jgi:hypothetical protein
MILQSLYPSSHPDDSCLVSKGYLYTSDLIRYCQIDFLDPNG